MALAPMATARLVRRASLADSTLGVHRGVFVCSRPGIVGNCSYQQIRHRLSPPWASMEGDSVNLERLQRRVARYKGLLRTLAHPPVKEFTVDGITYELPLRVQPFPLEEVSERDLQYAAGFFDGDGCAYIDARGRPYLHIAQSVKHARPLLWFRAKFGGIIRLHKGGVGARQPCIAWQVVGARAVELASFMSQVPSVKRPQLDLLARTPGCTREELASMAASAKLLKRIPHAPLESCTWAYAAGIFDAEGCVRVLPISPTIDLSLGQKYAAVLECLKRLILNEFPGCPVRIETGPYLCRLELTSVKFSPRVLSKLFREGLLVKREAAEVALSLTADNHLEVRSKLAEWKGAQSRYARLDAEGCKRSREINRLASRAQRSAAHPEHPLMLERLAAMRGQHEVEKLICAARLLREDIRALLRVGARRVPQAAGRSGSAPLNASGDGEVL